MAGVTDKGWESKLYSSIVTKFSEDAKLRFGGDFSSTPESVFGGLSNIIASPIKDIWDLGQAVVDTQNRSTATGVYLDYLAELVGLTRLRSSGATGTLKFTGKSGTTVVENTVCKDIEGRVVLTTSSEGLNRSSCYESTFTITSVQENTDYTINVEGVPSTINSGSSTSPSFILESIRLLIETNNDTVNTLVDNTLIVQYPSPNNLLTTTNSNNITLTSVGTLIQAESAESGDITFESGVINKLVTPNLGITSVINPTDFTTGREQETDSELRVRMSEREQSTGTATKPSIESSISEISGVTNVLVLVNDTLTEDVLSGRPPKTFETFVDGGDDDDIAAVLWTTKPAIGVSHGTTEKTIVDSNGDTQSVKFSRPINKFGWIRVTYTINSEEDFPTGGEATMKVLVTDKGNSMYRGEDLAPTKFYGTLYTVNGIYVNKIEVAVTDTESETPTYVETNIPVDKTEFLTFDESRVVITS